MAISIAFDGAVCADLVELDLVRTDGEPCDAFEARLLWSEGAAEAARGASRARIYSDGELKFTGVVDEVVSSVGEEGRVLEVAGRGLAALMMERELSGGEFEVAAWREVRDRFIAPCGISTPVGVGGSVRRFSVTSGTSCWKALCDWAGAACGVSPRFAADGSLLLDAGGSGALVLDGGSAIFAAERRTLRVGVISEVVISERATGRSRVVRSDELWAKGLRARMALAAPRGALEHRVPAARWELEKARRQADRFSVTLAGGFLCEPGDELRASAAALPARGRVSAVRTVLDGRGWTTSVEGWCE